MNPADLLHFALSDIRHGDIEPGFCHPGRPDVLKAPALGQAAEEKATMEHGKSLLAPVTDGPQLDILALVLLFEKYEEMYL